MLAFVGAHEQMVGVLHDAIEDSYLTPADLVTAGYPPKVVEAIVCLSRRSGEPYSEYVERVDTNAVARRIKLVDLADNLVNNRRSPDALGNAERIIEYETALARLGAEPQGGPLSGSLQVLAHLAAGNPAGLRRPFLNDSVGRPATRSTTRLGCDDR